MNIEILVFDVYNEFKIYIVKIFNRYKIQLD